MNHTNIAKLLRYLILESTTVAGSGHPTSSISFVEVMAVLVWGGYLNTDLNKPRSVDNDKIIFSKGHAAPLLYAAYTAMGAMSHSELLTLRKFGSVVEGHPTMDWEYTEVATGSLGQGLGVGVGMALGQRRLKNDKKTFVVLGDSELAEGSVWEAAEIADYYKLNNLVALVDANRLGQTGETQHGHDTNRIAKKFAAFGWKAVEVENGNDTEQVTEALKLVENTDKPLVLIFKTYKGAGISFLQDADNWHGKSLPQSDFEKAVKELDFDVNNVDGQIKKSIEKLPQSIVRLGKTQEPEIVKTVKVDINSDRKTGENAGIRDGYGSGIVALSGQVKDMVVLDAETSNSTRADKFKDLYEDRFYEMFIAEQNMISVGLGLSKMGLVPFCSSFAAFLSRAYDQVRCLPYSEGNVKVVGSHCGVSIGPDGSSQMALEDIAAFRAVEGSVILYPSDAVSMEKVVALAYNTPGFVYIRSTRDEVENRYSNDHEFRLGGSHVLQSSDDDIATVFAAGVTVDEAMKAANELLNSGINIKVVDLYSIKPLDIDTVVECLRHTPNAIVVEDHHRQGGLYSAICEELEMQKVAGNIDFNYTLKSLAVTKTPHSGTKEELLRYMEIDAKAIIDLVQSLTIN